MSDIVERLRSTEFASATDGLKSPVIWVKGEVAREAADEIEKLRAERDALREALREAKDLYLHGSTTSAFIEICAALGEKE
jgi:hypothetical protein